MDIPIQIKGLFIAFKEPSNFIPICFFSIAVLIGDEYIKAGAISESNTYGELLNKLRKIV